MNLLRKSLPAQFVNMFLWYDALFVLAFTIYWSWRWNHGAIAFVGVIGTTVLLMLPDYKEWSTVPRWMFWVYLSSLLLVGINTGLASFGLMEDVVGWYPH